MNDLWITLIMLPCFHFIAAGLVLVLFQPFFVRVVWPVCNSYLGSLITFGLVLSILEREHALLRLSHTGVGDPRACKVSPPAGKEAVHGMSHRWLVDRVLRWLLERNPTHHQCAQVYPLCFCTLSFLPLELVAAICSKHKLGCCRFHKGRLKYIYIYSLEIRESFFLGGIHSRFLISQKWVNRGH